MSICVDSSFLVSSYVTDAHSLESDRRRLEAATIWINPLNRSEFTHAVFQNVFRRRISLDAGHQLWSLFEMDCAAGLWAQVSLPQNVWQTTIDLARRHGPTLGVRTLDSLHVACALELGAERFWTFDDRQIRLAEAVGLNTSA